MTPHQDKIDAFLEDLKQTTEFEDPLPERIVHSKQFALAWLMLAAKFRKSHQGKVIPNDVLKEYNGKIRKPLFYNYIEDMCKMNHIMKVPGTGTSRVNPLALMMKDIAFVHESLFQKAMSVLGENKQHEGG